MKRSDLTASWPKRNVLAALWLKLVLGLGLGLVAGSSTLPPSGVYAQNETDPFPGTLVAEGTWPAIQPSQTLVRLDGHNILIWEPATGQYQLWPYDPMASGAAAPLAAQAIVQGTLATPRPGYEMVNLGENRLLTWEPSTGQYLVWSYDPTASGAVGPLAGPAVVQGTLSDIQAGYQLIYLGSQKVLAWEPATGRYQIWRYDPNLSGQIDSFPGELMVEGTWPTIGPGHELVYLGSHRLLDWEPATGRYRIWRYDPMVTGQANPLVGEPVVEGVLSDIQPGSELLNLGHNRLLDWEPASGHYRIWQYEFAAIGAFSLEDIATKLSAQNLTGLTVITHGFQLFNDGGDSLMPLAEAIHQESGGWLLDYDVPDDGANGFFDTCTNDCGPPSLPDTGELVLLFDWAPESNETTDGWGEAAGDALFSMLVGLGLVDPLAADNLPLHFIGHSFGTAVTSEAVERLTRYSVPVDHLTYLDPHDFDQAGVPVDEDQRLFDLGKPDGYGATVWQTVSFADVYYQTRGLAGSLTFIPVPEGRPIPGAYNKFFDGELPAESPNPYPIGDFSGDHSYIWNCFYVATVKGSLPAGCPPPAEAVNFDQTGYAFSRIAAGQSLRPVPVFYGADQGHEHSRPELVDVATGQPNQTGLANLGLTEEQVTQGRWTPAWKRLTIINGDFEKSGACGSCIKPGWSHHGGGGSGHFEQDQTVYLELDAGNTTHSHNWLYVPPEAARLRFDLRRNLVTSADRLEVRLGGQTLSVYALDGDDSDFTSQEVALPGGSSGQTITVTFQIVQEGLFVGSEAWIDNVQFLTSTYLPIIIKGE